MLNVVTLSVVVPEGGREQGWRERERAERERERERESRRGERERLRK